jgi:hypothetical protein
MFRRLMPQVRASERLTSRPVASENRCDWWNRNVRSSDLTPTGARVSIERCDFGLGSRSANAASIRRAFLSLYNEGGRA